MRQKQVLNYPNYMVEDIGKVFSVKSNIYLKGDVDRYGYLHFILFNDAGKKHFTAHRLVAIHFLDGDHSLQVNHKDGNRLNNHFENLEWATPLENHQHSIEVLGRNYKGSKNPAAKIDEETVLKIKLDLFNGDSQHTVAARYSISRSTISMIAINKIWSHINFIQNGNKEINRPLSNLQESK